MCGRYSFSVDAAKKAEAQIKLPLPDYLKTSYNIAPSAITNTITADPIRKFRHMHWGIPANWQGAKGHTRIINARVETVNQKTLFSESFNTRRCLVLADSFYEWRTIGRSKLPYRFFTAAPFFYMAGLYTADNKGSFCFSILTQASNPDIDFLHDRMPIIFTAEATAFSYLEASDGAEALSLCVQPPEGTLQNYQVTQLVNKVGIDKPSLHEPFKNELF